MNVKLQVSGNGVALLRVQYFIAVLVLEANFFTPIRTTKQSIYVEIHVFVLII